MRKSFLRNLNNNLYLHFNVAPIIIIFTDSARDLNPLTFSPTGNVVDAQLYVSKNTCRPTCNTNLFVKTEPNYFFLNSLVLSQLLFT